MVITRQPASFLFPAAGERRKNVRIRDSCQWKKILSRIEEPAKTGTCVHDRRALQQLDLNVHVKYSDLT